MFSRRPVEAWVDESGQANFCQSLFAPAKAPEGWRSPRRSASAGRWVPRVSVLNCGGPPPQFSRMVRTQGILPSQRGCRLERMAIRLSPLTVRLERRRIRLGAHAIR